MYVHIFLYSAMYVKCKMYVLNLCVHVCTAACK